MKTEKQTNTNLKGKNSIMAQKVNKASVIHWMFGSVAEHQLCLLSVCSHQLLFSVCLLFGWLDAGVFTVYQSTEADWWQERWYKQTEARAAEAAWADPLPGEWHWRPEEADLWTWKDQSGQGDQDQSCHFLSTKRPLSRILNSFTFWSLDVTHMESEVTTVII